MSRFSRSASRLPEGGARLRASLRDGATIVLQAPAGDFDDERGGVRRVVSLAADGVELLSVAETARREALDRRALIVPAAFCSLPMSVLAALRLRRIVRGDRQP